MALLSNPKEISTNHRCLSRECESLGMGIINHLIGIEKKKIYHPAALQEHACQALLESITQRQALQMPGDFHTIQAVIELQAQLQNPEGAGQNHRQCVIEVPAEGQAFKTIREGGPFQAAVEIPSKGQGLQSSDATEFDQARGAYFPGT